MPRVSLITLGVSDLQRSLVFYRDGLGFPTTWDGSRGVVFFQNPGSALALYPYDKLAEDISPDFVVARAKFSGITLAQNFETAGEVDAFLEKALSAGAKLEKAAQKTFWGGYHAYFSDPDGHVWELASGAFPINADGSLAIP